MSTDNRKKHQQVLTRWRVIRTDIGGSFLTCPGYETRKAAAVRAKEEWDQYGAYIKRIELERYDRTQGHNARTLERWVWRPSGMRRTAA